MPNLLESQTRIQFLLAYFFHGSWDIHFRFPLIFINVLFIQALHRRKKCCTLLILLPWTGYNIFSEANTLIDFKVSVIVGKSFAKDLRGGILWEVPGPIKTQDTLIYVPHPSFIHVEGILVLIYALTA